MAAFSAFRASLREPWSRESKEVYSPMARSKLAIFGGPKAIRTPVKDMFTWPIITKEDEAAVLDVLRRRAMSDLDVTRKFEAEFAKWQRRKYALAHSSGT